MFRWLFDRILTDSIMYGTDITRNKNSQANFDVAAECRHDMRPYVQLPSISGSGADSKLGLTMA